MVPRIHSWPARYTRHFSWFFCICFTHPWSLVSARHPSCLLSSLGRPLIQPPSALVGFNHSLQPLLCLCFSFAKKPLKPPNLSVSVFWVLFLVFPQMCRSSSTRWTFLAMQQRGGVPLYDANNRYTYISNDYCPLFIQSAT